MRTMTAPPTLSELFGMPIEEKIDRATLELVAHRTEIERLRRRRWVRNRQQRIWEHQDRIASLQLALEGYRIVLSFR